MDERIFISYKRVNKEQVFALKKRIEDELGVKCWVDLDGIESNAQFISKICAAIDRCDMVLFMHSNEHTKIEDFDRDWTIRELNYADVKQKKTVLVKLDDAQLDNYFLMMFGAQNNIDSRNPDQWKILMRDLRRWLKLTTATTAPHQYSQQELKELNRKGYEYCEAKQYEKAVECYRKGAEQGNAAAQSNLGVMYRIGYGVPQDYAEALRWFRKAAEQGNAAAQSNLGWMYYNGYGVPQDYAEAVRWYRKAAEQGNVSAQNNLANMYHSGTGVQQDDVEAMRWCRKAAENGSAIAQATLGYIYCKGQGIQQDYNKAEYWYRKAAEQGDAIAQNNLALMYKKGEGVKKDLNEARLWFQKAADQGNKDAEKALQDL